MTAQQARRRLDQVLVERGLVESRSAARGLVMAGEVLVCGVVVDKAGALVADDAPITLKARRRYVSRAGDKLAHALRSFSVEVRDAFALDIGSSTGGFVDCLLQEGAAAVIAVDVGYGLIDARLRADPRVHLLERTNARYLRPEQLPFVPDLLTVDASFISLRTILPAVVECMAPTFRGLLLVKPQFEVGPRKVGKGGIVRDPEARIEAVRAVADFCREGSSLAVRGVVDSGLPGAQGNREYVLWVERGGGAGLPPDTLSERIVTVVMSEGGTA